MNDVNSKQIRFDATNLDYRTLNDQIKAAETDVLIDNCYGQRFIGAGFNAASNGGKNITINGTPGNALGAYLNGAVITVNGNVQDAVGDTMNDGTIIINGNAGDALGYAMRGGKIFVRGNAGYRTGIHMKEYKPTDGSEKRPVIVVGGKVGSFLGEYLAGGIIVVLGLDCDGVPVGNFTGTGMHGGAIFIRCDGELPSLPAQVTAEIASESDMLEIEPLLSEYADSLSMNLDELLSGQFYKLKANAKNPYKQLYTAN